jgi:hypothetical protein
VTEFNLISAFTNGNDFKSLMNITSGRILGFWASPLSVSCEKRPRRVGVGVVGLPQTGRCRGLHNITRDDEPSFKV